MKKMTFPFVAGAAIALLFAACNNDKTKETSTATDTKLSMNIKEDTARYSVDSIDMIGYVAWDASTENKRPVVLVVPEWWGLNDYAKSRAKQLAELGYLAFAVDVYGNAMQADNPTDAQNMVTPFYANPALGKPRFDAALQKALSYPVADANKVAAIGYCFGGTQVLNAALLGSTPLKGVVSFHGGLETAPVNKDLLKADILICHGGADPMVPADHVAAFRKKLDSISASYKFETYPQATHAFTNPASTANGQKFNIPIAYNAAADTASWKEMKVFFDKIFK